MRIHSDVLTEQDLTRACYEPFWCEAMRHGSRKRDHAFEVRLAAPKLPGRQYRNSGKFGADGVYAATYQEWGWWLLTLFEIDPNAICGPYNGLEDFHAQTEHQFTRRVAPDAPSEEHTIAALRAKLNEELDALNTTLNTNGREVAHGCAN